VALLRCLLISYGPPHYGMGYALCQLLGDCAPWPGEKRWVLICFTAICMGYGLRRHPCCPQLGCGSGPSSDVGGWSPAAGAMAEEVIAWATASDDIRAVHSWVVAVVHPPMWGGGHPLLVRWRRRLFSLFGGGFTAINAFRRLPCPLWWVLVGGPSECYPVVSYCVCRPVRGGLDFFTTQKGDVALEYLWASACVCPPEGGPKAFGCVITGNA
jgi:hypothetical protein